ncbi:hypothetical protein [Micromonospora sp. CPCC 206061]|uniref:hypothetical protein n=1 Tax=Micromonospora sp. CPCC 206061 TaxID=3122410 RepID=UPI002FF24C9D
MEGERWNGAPQEWDGYRIPGPRGQRDGFEADPLTAALPYGSNDSGNPLAAAASRESVWPLLEEPTGAVAPVSPRPADTTAFPSSGAGASGQGGYAVELGLTVANPSMAAPGPSLVGAPAATGGSSFGGGQGGPSAPPGPAVQEHGLQAPPVAPPMPPQAAPPQPEPVRFHAEPIDRASLRRPSAPIAPVGDGVYRTRRPAVGLALLALTVIFEVPALRLFLDAAIGGPVSAAALVSGLFLVIGLPLFALGLYALATGATRLAPEAGGGAQVWLRPPVAYLPIALILLLAAALAAGP